MQSAERQGSIDAFLAAAGWGAAARAALAGDASARRYLRLKRAQGETAVLMDAAPAAAGPVGPFLRIAGHLARLGFSVPAVIAADAAAGLVLLEDLGDGLFARLADAEPQSTPTLYAAATDLLAALHAHPPPADLPAYAGALLGEQAALVLETYAPQPQARAELAEAVTKVCGRLAPGAPVLMLRDFHAENLFWLPGRAGVARVGLIDFQDAMAGHPAYDLISLLQDARRDVDPALAAACSARYCAATRADPEAFATACAALGALRQLRILGVFARLAQGGKPRYLDFMPRVWGHLQACLAHPDLAELRALVDRLVPAPDPVRLEALRCGR
jgi:aminoglycoside/choline kinase family phosphotransferase